MDSFYAVTVNTEARESTDQKKVNKVSVNKIHGKTPVSGFVFS